MERPEIGGRRGGRLCKLKQRPEDFGKNLVNALTKGFVAGVGEDASGWLVNGLS